VGGMSQPASVGLAARAATGERKGRVDYLVGNELPARPAVCTRCRRRLNEVVYEVRSQEGRRARCLRCAVTYRPVMATSLGIALIVGTILTAINQGQLIVGGEFPMALAWKIPLTYAVPYCVATTGAILNARTKTANSGGKGGQR